MLSVRKGRKIGIRNCAELSESFFLHKLIAKALHSRKEILIKKFQEACNLLD